MRMLLLAVILSPIMALAMGESNPNPPQPVRPLDPIEGSWVLKARRCSSGMPVRDGFYDGRDMSTLSFYHGNYDGHTRVGGCHYWSSGKYSHNGDMLTVFDVVGASNCNSQPPAPRDSAMIRLSENTLKIYSQPMPPGGACPARDILEMEFIRH